MRQLFVDGLCTIIRGSCVGNSVMSYGSSAKENEEGLGGCKKEKAQTSSRPNSNKLI